MVASVLGIAGSGCFSGSDDPAEDVFVFGCHAVSNWCGDLIPCMFNLVRHFLLTE